MANSCKYCNLNFKILSSLTRHIRHKHYMLDETTQSLDNSKKFSCENCNHKFIRKDSLKNT